MELPRDAVLLRIFVGEDARFGHRPLYEAIVTKAREMHLAGATVLRGPMGFGHTSQIHTTKILNLAENLPVVIEIVDSQAKVDAFLPVLN
jgi:PII-like signaling protein